MVCTSQSEGKIFCSDRLSGFRQPLLVWKNITEAALESFHDNLKPSQCDALCALLQSKQRRRRKTHLLGKGFEGHVAPLLLEEDGELLVQWGLHPLEVNENPFRIRNN